MRDGAGHDSIGGSVGRLSVGVLLGIVALVAVVGAVAVGMAVVALRSVDVDVGPSPGPGTESERVPVAVTPASGLSDGSVVTVTSDAFTALRVVGVAVCLPEADTESAGVEACDDISGARYAIDATGHLEATFAVPRVITVGGTAHDCATVEPGCLVVAADAGDYDRSGGETVRFLEGLPAVDLVPVTVRPITDRLTAEPPDLARVFLEAGPVSIRAEGFQPGEPIIVALCADVPDDELHRSCVDEPGSTEAAGALLTRSVEHVTRHADEDGVASVEVEPVAVVAPVLSNLQVSCDVEPARCSVVVAAAADTKRSAVVPYRTGGT